MWKRTKLCTICEELLNVYPLISSVLLRFFLPLLLSGCQVVVVVGGVLPPELWRARVGRKRLRSAAQELKTEPKTTSAKTPPAASHSLTRAVKPVLELGQATTGAVLPTTFAERWYPKDLQNSSM